MIIGSDLAKVDATTEEEIARHMREDDPGAPAADIHLAEVMIARIQALYGTPCPDKDTDDPEIPRELNAAGRCPCCAANEVVEWLRDNFIADAISEEEGP